MELIVISDSKLKIMLSGEDMKQYSIDCETLDYENTETRRAFWSILDEAKQRTGFDAASEKVFVQVYPSKDGGCEMYVTKLGVFSDRIGSSSNAATEEIRIKEQKNGGRSRMKKGSYITVPEREKRQNSTRKRSSAYSFEKIEDMLSACKRLHYAGFEGASSAYVCGSTYYLTLIHRFGEDTDKPKFEELICEYGDELSESALSTYIGEYGKCICKFDAIKTLAEL